MAPLRSDTADRQPLPPIDWRDGVAVITGGAAGIGRACAAAFAERGMHLVLADRDEATLAATRHQLSQRFSYPPRRIFALPTDVTSDEDVEALAAETLDRFGRVDVVMANAGIAVGGSWEHIPASEWARVYDVNVVGAMRVVRALLPPLLGRQRGWVVLTASSHGLFAETASAGPYAASKAALIAAGKSLALYGRPRGVGVTVLCPRLTDTAFPHTVELWSRQGPASVGQRELPPGTDQPEDVAALLLDALDHQRFLASSTPDTAARLAAWWADPDAELDRLTQPPA